MTTTLLAESDLIARCRDGDQEAFRQLVELHHERVYRTAYALTMDAGEADEVVQETLLKAWRGLRRFRGEAALATWLTRLTLNTARDHLRRRRTRDMVSMLPGLRSLQPDRADAVRGVEERDEVQCALLRLSPPARQVVALRYGLDLSLKAIGQVLGCPEGTVKSRLNSALGKLREIMQRDRGMTP